LRILGIVFVLEKNGGELGSSLDFAKQSMKTSNNNVLEFI